jgi:hypothetical protein
MAEMYRVEIFAVGTWVGNMGPTKWTQEDLGEIVANTNALMSKGTLKPKLKFGHSSEQFWEEAEVLENQSDGDPGIGNGVNFAIKDEFIVCDFIGMPDIVFNIIEAGLYDSVSAEVNYIQNFGWFISAVALLGADAPAVKTLDDLQAFLSDKTFTPKAVPQVLTFSNPNFRGKDMSDTNKDKTEGTKTPAGIDPATAVIVEDNAVLKQKFSDSEAARAAAESKAKASETELEGYRKKALEVQFSEQKASVLSSYTKDVTDGLLMPALLTKIENHLDEQKVNFALGNTLSLSPELAREVAQAYSEKLPVKNYGDNNSEDETGLAPDEAFELEINKLLSSNSSLNYREASDHVSRTKPQVLKAYVEWTDKVSELGKPQGVA